MNDNCYRLRWRLFYYIYSRSIFNSKYISIIFLADDFIYQERLSVAINS